MFQILGELHMLNKIFIFLFYAVFAYCSSDGIAKEDPKLDISNNQFENMCFAVYTNHSKQDGYLFPEFLAKKFRLPLNKEELIIGGLEYRVLLKKDSIYFLTYSSDIIYNYKLFQVEHGVFKFGNEHVDLFLALDRLEKNQGVRFHYSKSSALKNNSIPYYKINDALAFGNEIKIENKDCLDRTFYKEVYEQVQREIEAGSEPDNGYQKIGGVGYYTLIADSVILREEPSKVAKGLLKLKKGAIVALLEETKVIEEVEPYGKHSWVKVRLEDGKVGYIFGAFVKWKGYFPEGYKID